MAGTQSGCMLFAVVRDADSESTGFVDALFFDKRDAERHIRFYREAGFPYHVVPLTTSVVKVERKPDVLEVTVTWPDDQS